MTKSLEIESISQDFSSLFRAQDHYLNSLRVSSIREGYKVSASNWTVAFLCDINWMAKSSSSLKRFSWVATTVFKICCAFLFRTLVTIFPLSWLTLGLPQLMFHVDWAFSEWRCTSRFDDQYWFCMVSHISNVSKFSLQKLQLLTPYHE